MRIKKRKLLIGLGGLNLLFIAGLAYLLTGCATSTNTMIKDAKKEIALRNLLNQEHLEKRSLLTIKETLASDIMKKELAAQRPDPVKPIGRTYTPIFSQKAIELNPSLSLRKYTTTILSSKTGQKATYTTSFSILNMQLANFVSRRFYIKMKYLDIIIQEEATKKGYSSDYIANIRKSMRNGYGGFSAFVANMNMRGSEYLNALEAITYRAIALYNLSSQSAKLSAIVYYLQHSEFDKVDEILRKKWKAIATKKADKINSKKYSSMKSTVKIYRDMDIEDIKKTDSIQIRLYFAMLPKSVVDKRKQELKERLKKFFEKVKKENLYNGYEILQKFNHDSDMMNSFTLAIINSGGNKHPFMADYSIHANSCLVAGVNSIINFSMGMRHKRRYLIDNLAYNIGVLENLKCPEAPVFRQKLDEVLEKVKL